MKLDRLDSLTGLPTVHETRKREFWRSLPRKIKELAVSHDEREEGTPWYPRHHEWNGHVLQRVRCWKCGIDLKGWRAMLQPHKIGFSKDGKPIAYSEANLVKIGGKPAVAFLPLPHMTSTPVGVRVPSLNRTMVFAAQHCLDCTLTHADAEHLFCCFLAGTDANLWNAQNHQSALALTPDRWATYLYRWHNAEPIGLLTPQEAEMAEAVPAPGELITSAHVIVNQDLAERAMVPPGAIVEYEGAEAPSGWMLHPTKPQRIVKL